MKLDHGVPNLSIVDPENWIIRMGQPKDAAAWAYVRSLFPPGTEPKVIKLNPDAGDELSGLEVLPFPISFLQQVWGPVKPQLDGALAEMTKYRIVHCARGQNRTGAAVIAYRVQVCGWSLKLAIAEADKFEFEWSLPALQEFVYSL